MNRFKFLVTAFLSIVLGAGVASGVAANDKHVEAVEAATINSPTGTRAILWEDNWNKAGSSNNMYIHYWGGSSSSSWNTKPRMINTGKTNAGGNKIYYYNVPSDTTKFLIYYTTDNQQTPDILVSTFNNANSNCGYWVWNNGVSYGHYSCTSVTGTLKYHSNLTTDTTTSATFSYGAKVTVEANTFTNEGYTFKEWNSKKDGTGTSYSANDVFYAPGAATLDLYAIWVKEYYAVNEYEVLDGVLNSTPIKTSQQSGTYAATQPSKAGYVSKGVFLDKDGKTPYTGTISVATNLYHIYESEVYDYIYLGGMDINSDWCGGKEVNFYLYTFNKETNELFHGEWPGTKITIGDYVALGSNFNGYGYYRLPLLANGVTSPTHFIIITDKVENYACKSADLEINFGSYYLMDTLMNGATTGFEGDVEDGEQAALAYDLNLLRLNGETISYNGKNYKDSICSISYDDANDIITRYQDLTENDKFNGTKYYTHNVDGKSITTGGTTFVDTEADYTASEIISVLMRKYDITSKLNFLAIRSSDSPVVSIVVIVSILSLGAIVLVIRKRKQTSK